ncbi:MAG TPA: hypothetical protein VN660_10745 [Steroidobacteraceae bacterium]|nr:hypothetical protein [Steroidobacteraceae bacterium]
MKKFVSPYRLLAVGAFLLLAACGSNVNRSARQAAIATFTVTPSGSNLTISPATSQIVNAGATQAFIVTADAGYTVSDTVAGTCAAGSFVGSTYTTGAITANCTVTFTAISTRTVGGTIAGLSGTVVLLNEGGDPETVTKDGAFTFSTPLPEGSSYNVTVGTQPSGQTCTVTDGSGPIGGSNVTNVVVTCAPNTTALTATPSTLALSVNCPSAGGACVYSNAALTGNAREITITNTSAAYTTTALTVTPASFPTGTSITTDSCTGSTLPPLGSCTLAITPGQVATSACTTGIEPTPGTVTVNASNAAGAVTLEIVVVGYGCIYQGGFVYSIDDTTAPSGSIGGKVAALTDQAEPYIDSGPQATSIIWSSNGAGNAGSDVSFDIIPLIADTSATTASYAAALASFNGTYANTSTYPFPASSAFANCSGSTDGACNSGNIAALLNAYITSYGMGASPYTLSPGPTAAAYYAAGLCSVTNSGGYSSGWYLPAACEMGSTSSGASCVAGGQNMADNLPSLLGDPSAGTPSTSCSPASGTECLAGYYWSSTEYSSSPQNYAWYQYFASSGSTTAAGSKSNQFGVRCSRAFTP